MKTLIVIRHAEAVAKNLETDFERELTPKGHQEAEDTGRKLAEAGYVIDAIMASPAERTMETAQIIQKHVNAKNLEFEQKLYHASSDDLVEFVREGFSRDVVLNGNIIAIVGHNPAVSQFASSLGTESSVMLETGSAVVYEFLVNSWHELRVGHGAQKDHFIPKIESAAGETVV